MLITMTRCIHRHSISRVINGKEKAPKVKSLLYVVLRVKGMDG